MLLTSLRRNASSLVGGSCVLTFNTHAEYVDELVLLIRLSEQVDVGTIYLPITSD